MDREHPPARREPAESAEGAADRADLRRQKQTEWRGTWSSRPDRYANREAWRRILAAHMQPLPEAAD